MSRSSFDDFLEELETKGKLNLHPPARKRKGKKLARDLVEAIEEYDREMRESLRPLSSEERGRLVELVEDAPNCGPEPEDAYVVMKVLDFSSFVVEDDADPQFIAFSLGMAYQKLRDRRESENGS